jgi:hypothetical protein
MPVRTEKWQAPTRVSCCHLEGSSEAQESDFQVDTATAFRTPILAFISIVSNLELDRRAWRLNRETGGRRQFAT